MTAGVVRRALDLALGGVVVRDRRRMEGRRGGVRLRIGSGAQMGSGGLVEKMRT
jgi:hypothetical protein